MEGLEQARSRSSYLTECIAFAHHSDRDVVLTSFVSTLKSVVRSPDVWSDMMCTHILLVGIMQLTGGIDWLAYACDPHVQFAHLAEYSGSHRAQV